MFEFREREGLLSIKSRILTDQNWKGNVYQKVFIQFSSVFRSNAAYFQVTEGGRLTGNGWDTCTFFGARISEVVMEGDRYQKCAMGQMYLSGCQLWGIKAADCNYAGSCWKYAEIEGCVFTNCNFRNVQFQEAFLKRNTFDRCTFNEAIMEDCVLSENKFRNCRLEK